MSLEPKETAYLVASLLAVNFFPLDRAYALMPAFEERGLLDPNRIGALPHAELIAAMNEAGYRRGGYVPIISFRLYTLMDAIAAGTLGTLPALANAGEKAEFIATLATVPGFGPRTADSAWTLFTTADGVLI